MPARPGRQATKSDLLAIAQALGMPTTPDMTSADLATQLRAYTLTVREERDVLKKKFHNQLLGRLNREGQLL